jgi:hypothetical protein
VSPKSGTIYVDEEADTATLYYWLSNLRSSFVTGIKGTYPTPSHERTLKEVLGR